VVGGKSKGRQRSGRGKRILRGKTEEKEGRD
jgi:hypothetical protein